MPSAVQSYLGRGKHDSCRGREDGLGKSRTVDELEWAGGRIGIADLRLRQQYSVHSTCTRLWFVSQDTPPHTLFIVTLANRVPRDFCHISQDFCIQESSH